MPKHVIKKDGRKEPFIKEKIIVSAVKTGAPVEIARNIADEIEKHPDKKIKTIWIKKHLLGKLELHNPDLPKKWYNYDKNVKRIHKYWSKQNILYHISFNYLNKPSMSMYLFILNFLRFFKEKKEVGKRGKFKLY